MKDDKTIKDVMINIFDYPHVPYWFSIGQAIKIVRISLASSKQRPDPMAVLVFDEKYNLMGTLTLKDLLKGLEPKFLRADIKAQVPHEEEADLSILWDSLFNSGSKELAEKPVSEIMVPAKFFVEPGDAITKAAYLMIRHDMALLPVLEGKKKFVGLVRMTEIFDTLAGAIAQD
jgi:CBS domain-containing protein